MTDSVAIRTFRDVSEGVTTTLCGRTYVVVPVVALVEGVRHGVNQDYPELVLADSFGRHPGTWNGRPVVLNHPVSDSGKALLASDADVLERSYLGELMNTRVEDGKLITEAWFDVAAIKSSTSKPVKAIWKRLSAGETIEVSVGAIVYPSEESGVYQGARYKGRWEIVIPDHLAVLDGGQVGACSVEDGCGTFRTQAAGFVHFSKGVLMSVEDALRRVASGTGTKKVAGACNCAAGDNASDGENCGCRNCTNKALSDAITRTMFSGQTFDADRRALLQRSISERFKGVYTYVVAYNDNEVVFGMDDGECYHLYSLPFSSDDTNGISLDKGDPVEVMLQMKTAPVVGESESAGSGKGKGKAMAGKSKAGTVAASEVEDDDVGEEAVEVVAAKPKKAQMSNGVGGAGGVNLSSLASVDDLIKALGASPLAKQLSSAMAVEKLVRTRAIAAILANPAAKGSFTEDQLSGLDIAVLDNMAKAFSQTAAVAVEEEEEEEEAPAMGLGFMDYAVEGTPAAKGLAKGGSGVAAPARAANYAGRAGGRGGSGGGVPTPIDVFAFENGRMKTPT